MELKSSLRILTDGSPKSMLTLQDQMETSQIQTVLFYELLSFKPSHTQVLKSNPDLCSLCCIVAGLWRGAEIGRVLKGEGVMSRPRAGSLLLLHTYLLCLSHLWFTRDKGDCVHLPILFFLRMSVLSFSLPLCEFLEGPLLNWENW